MKRMWVLVLLALLLSGCGGVDSARFAPADEAIENAIAQGTIPGAVLAVVHNGKTVYQKAYGNKAVVPDTVAMTTETVFDLASVSKCVGTTLSFMQLLEQGKVSLEDKVSDYIPDFAPWVDTLSGEQVDITIEDLLTHSSGIAPYIAVDEYIARFGEATPDSLVRFIATEAKRNFRPGADGYLYSCLNFITLQAILEKVTGEKLCDYAQSNIFDALSLKHTCYQPKNHPDILPLVAPTELQEDGTCLCGEVHDPTARVVNCGNSGNAGVFSNAEDLTVICKTILAGGKYKGTRILQSSTVKTMASVHAENGRALGWDISSKSSKFKGNFGCEAICHTGYTGDSVIIDFETNTAVILLAHRVHPQDKGSLAALRKEVSNVVLSALE